MQLIKAFAWGSLLAASMGVSAHAACTSASLIGAYGFQEEGQFIGGGYPQFRSVGTITFDGHGNGSRTGTIWYGGSPMFIAPGDTNPISYSVNSDCTFTYTYLTSGEIFSGVIVTGGTKLLWLETNPGGDPMRSGQAERIRSAQ